eukprot:TRINITY_DN4561_c0_g2_i1.p1 TRINITY_DN4561_c0_g2~~TRINITY_DN4561_c0_g2_i1.p1  ORF type:complete len:913 (+),score=196.73 TRINITY_DN4561_c0_g2_i1:528-3266(+)
MSDGAVLKYGALLSLLAVLAEQWTGHVAVRWALLASILWVGLQYGSLQRRREMEEQKRALEVRWEQLQRAERPLSSAKEPTEWLTRLLHHLWPNAVEPRVAQYLQRRVERNLREHRPKGIVGVDLSSFSLGHVAPEVGQGRTHWATEASGQAVLYTDISWDSAGLEVEVELQEGRAGETSGGAPLRQPARVLLHSAHLQGQLRLLPILNGQGLLYGFVTEPAVKLGVSMAAGSPWSPWSLPTLQAWLEQALREVLHSPLSPSAELGASGREEHSGAGRFSLVPFTSVDLNKTAIGAELELTIESAQGLRRPEARPRPHRRGGHGAPGSDSNESWSPTSSRAARRDQRQSEGLPSQEDGVRLGDVVGTDEGEGDLVLSHTFVEVRMGHVRRNTPKAARRGPAPVWDHSVRLLLHDSEGLLSFQVFEQRDAVKCTLLGICEVQMAYGPDDSAYFWSGGGSLNSRVVAVRAERPGQAVRLQVPLEPAGTETLSIQLCVRNWIFLHKGAALAARSRPDEGLLQPRAGPPRMLWPPLRTLTGRTIRVTAVEARGLGLSGSLQEEHQPGLNPYLLLQYGKNSRRTRTAADRNPVWHEEMEFDEVEGEHHLLLSCWRAERAWPGKRASLGRARLNLLGLAEGSPRDIWLPLEQGGEGEVLLRLEVVRRAARGRAGDTLLGSRLPPGGDALPVVPEVASSVRGTEERLQVVIVEARNLRSGERGAQLDPFVSVRHGASKRKTKVVHKSLAPEWNAAFEFPLSRWSPLLLHLKNHRSLISTESLGHVEINPLSFPANLTEDSWFPLKEMEGAEIRVKLTRQAATPGHGHVGSEEDATEGGGQSWSALTTIQSLERTSDKLRLLLQNALRPVDGAGSPEMSALLDEVAHAEDEREHYLAQVLQDRALLVAKVQQMEAVMAAL